jgi:hypothetical protein
MKHNPFYEAILILLIIGAIAMMMVSCAPAHIFHGGPCHQNATLPARYYAQGAKTHSTLTRIEDILWNRYGYDVALKHTFKLL